ncbi:MAG: hypothetical protein ACYTXF_30605 [Nostoc sp.]
MNYATKIIYLSLRQEDIFSPRVVTFEADNFAELVGDVYAEVFYYEEPRIIFSGNNYCEIDAYVVNAGADSSL